MQDLWSGGMSGPPLASSTVARSRRWAPLTVVAVCLLLGGVAASVHAALAQGVAQGVAPSLESRIAALLERWLLGAGVAVALYYGFALAARAARVSGLAGALERGLVSLRVTNVDNARALGLGVLPCAVVAALVLYDAGGFKAALHELWEGRRAPAELKLLVGAGGAGLVFGAMLAGTFVIFSRVRVARFLGERLPGSALRYLAPALVPLLALGAAYPRLRPAPYGDAESVVVILVDCLRADHLSLYGYSRKPAPTIAAIARDGIVFDMAISQTNWTKPSIASLFTSLYPSQHQVLTGALPGDTGSVDGRPVVGVLNEDFLTLAETLHQAGFATGGFVNHGHLADYLGFAQGFEFYDQSLKDEELRPTFERWLRKTPFFAYFHFTGVHYPYLPDQDVFSSGDGKIRKNIRDGTKRFLQMLQDGSVQLTLEERQELIDLYDGEIRDVDDKIADLMRFLRSKGLYDNTMIVVTADHGEAMFEHGYATHGGPQLYNELVRVPLILKLPGNRHAGEKIRAPVQLVDLMPTILDHFDLPIPDQVSGQSLEARIVDDAPLTHAVFSETRDGVAVFLDGYKYVFYDDPPRTEVFNPENDPADARDISGRIDPELVAAAWSEVERWREANRAFAARYPLPEQQLQDKEIEKLKALGYLK